MSCIVQSHSLFLSYLLSFTFKCTASTPLKRENSLCVCAELRTCHPNWNFQYLLCVSGSGRQCVPAHFYSSNFPQWGSQKLSTVSYFWLRAASRGDKALDVENFQSSLHNDTICFVRFSLMVPDVQTLCLQSSIHSTPKQLHQCLCLSCVHLSHHNFMVLIPFPFHYPPESLFLEAVFRINWLWNSVTVAKFSQVIGNLCPPPPPPPPACSVNTSWFLPQVQQKRSQWTHLSQSSSKGNTYKTQDLPRGKISSWLWVLWHHFSALI